MLHIKLNKYINETWRGEISITELEHSDSTHVNCDLPREKNQAGGFLV